MTVEQPETGKKENPPRRRANLRNEAGGATSAIACGNKPAAERAPHFANAARGERGSRRFDGAARIRTRGNERQNQFSGSEEQIGLLRIRCLEKLRSHQNGRSRVDDPEAFRINLLKGFNWGIQWIVAAATDTARWHSARGHTPPAAKARPAFLSKRRERRQARMCRILFIISLTSLPWFTKCSACALVTGT